MGDGATLDLAIEIAEAIVDGGFWIVVASAFVGAALTSDEVARTVIDSCLFIKVAGRRNGATEHKAAFKITKRWIGLCGVRVVVARSRDGTSNDN